MNRLLGDVYAPLYEGKLRLELSLRVPGDRFTIKVARGRIVPCVMTPDMVIDLDVPRFKASLRQLSATKPWARKAIVDGVIG
jgi:hypothetical protein